jgi:hypothetical protein
VEAGDVNEARPDRLTWHSACHRVMTSSKVERRDVLAVAVRWIHSLRYSIPAIQRSDQRRGKSGAPFAPAKGVTLLIRPLHLIVRRLFVSP